MYPKGNFDAVRKDASDFAKDRYFSGYSDNCSVQENFNLITSFIQESADKHIPSKTNRSTSSVPWIIPEIRRKIHRRNRTYTKAKKTSSSNTVKKSEDFTVKYLASDCQFFYRYFYGRLPVEHF